LSASRLVVSWLPEITVGATPIRPMTFAPGCTSDWPKPAIPTTDGRLEVTARAPYYESRFIRANHPHRPRAVWLRETLLLSRSGTSSSDVWVMVFERSEAGNRALKRSHPLGEAGFGTDPWTTRIGETTLSDNSARGSLDGSPSASWDLRITPRGEPVKLLTERGYSARFPTAKTQVRSPLARFDGTLTVDDTTIDLDGWTGSVNHNWGRRHTPAYAFGQVCGFDEHPESTLEIVTARAALGPVSLPPVTLMVFRHAGQEFAVRSVLDSLHTRGSYRPFAWSFGASIDGLEMRGQLHAEPADVIGLTYTDTDDTSRYCYNSAIATCRIALSGIAFGPVELTATRRAMFEILTDTQRDEVPLLA
jgi:hypothetical protein